VHSRAPGSTYPGARLFGASGVADVMRETMPATARDVASDIESDVARTFSKS
jgi:hypothetical protein